MKSPALGAWPPDGRPAGAKRVDQGKDLFDEVGSEEEAVGPRGVEFGLVERGHEDHAGGPGEGPDEPRGLDAADVGHVDVDEDEVRRERGETRDGLPGRPGQADDLDARDSGEVRGGGFQEDDAVVDREKIR